MQNWKYFIPKDPENMTQLKELRRVFPGYYFLKGNHKGVKGCFALKDLNNKKYGAKGVSIFTTRSVSNGFIEAGQEIYFWEPACDRNDFNIKDWEKESFLGKKISITLSNGKVLRVVPATGEPEEMLFGDDEPEEERIPYASMFSRSSDYGRLGYELIYLEDELKDQGGIMVNDNRVKKFAELVLLNSYDLPLDIWNWLKYVSKSTHDLGEIYRAGMGADPSFLEEVTGGPK